MATGRLADGNARMKINYFVNSCVTLAASSSSMWATAAASTIFQFQCRPTFLQPPIPIFSCSSYKISPAFIYRIFMSLIFLDKALMLVVTRRASKIWLYLAAQPFFSLSFFCIFLMPFATRVFFNLLLNITHVIRRVIHFYYGASIWLHFCALNDTFSLMNCNFARNMFLCFL